MSYHPAPFEAELQSIEAAGLRKHERLIASPQDRWIQLQDGREVLNFCANNYLGLANHPALIAAAKAALDEWGFGLASVRFICGTQSLHRQLEQRIAEFLKLDDTILYSSCFDANGGLFETLLGPEDAIISDALNHASIIDGVRLCKAKRYRYANANMDELEKCLIESKDARRRLIATDGVFSMDGSIAPLTEICDLADRYDAMVMVDDSHAVGFIGKNGRGTPEFCGVEGRVDILTGTLGKALGGASGGYTCARQGIVDLLRQRSRPYLFSNTLAPCIAAAALATIDLIVSSTAERARLRRHTERFRSALTEAGFDIPVGQHPIVPVMLGDARVATSLSERLLEAGIYVIGFSYPVVPQGKARIRVQLSAAHTDEDIERAIEAFCALKPAMEINT
jgi:glycine C-acetyltransferase